MPDREAAIRTMEECRETHVIWNEWYDQGNPEDPIAGDRAHHERIIREYDNVLAVLRGA